MTIVSLSDDVPKIDYRSSTRTYRRLGFTLIVLFVAGFVAFSSFAPLSSAVIAIGRLEVTGNIKKIQHETGGVVAEILASEGARVKAGDTLFRLDATTAQAQVDILTRKLVELHLAAARLRAERDQQPDFALPTELADRENDPEVSALFAAEQRLFSVRRTAQEGQKSQLEARIGQYQSQIDGLKVQADAKQTEIDLTQTELDNSRSLQTKGITSQSRVNDLDRSLAQLQGEAGQIAAQIAELGGRIAETRLQMLTIDQTAIADAGRDLKDTESQIGELEQRRMAAMEQLRRTEIRAPIDGVVHDLAVHTVGGVIGAGELLATIVPTSGELDIEARLSPADIEAVHVGQVANIRFPGLNHATTPELSATVRIVGADLTEDPLTRQSYYPVTLDLSADEIKKLGDVELVPGMPVEAFISGGQRSLFDYLFAPIRDRMSHALREE